MHYFLVFILALLTLLFPDARIMWAQNAKAAIKPVFLGNFDQSNALGASPSMLVERKGGEIIPDGIKGGALRLKRNEYIALDASKLISPKEGTIMLWVRPHWSSGEKQSHTLASFEWTRGYFVLSDGWWEEGGGRPFTYFIFNNEDGAKTEKKIRYTKEKWIHLACTWKVGKEGFIYLYANGLMVSLGYQVPQTSQIPKENIYFGTDKGTPLGKERWADSDFDEIAIYNRALSDEEILSIYNQQNPIKPAILSDSRGNLLETRAIFDEGTGWMTKKGADKTIERIKKAGFNVYVPCVWHGQGTRYPSKLAPTENNVVFKSDPLAYLVKVAHENGIEVHPWFTVTLRDREFLKDFYEPGTPKDAFNVHKPEFRQFIVSLMLDVAERYHIDGINLDYIRSMGTCISHYCITQYQQSYGRHLVDDLMSKTSDGRRAPQVQEWINEAVEEIVRDISTRAKRMNSRLVISVDGYPMLHHEKPNTEGRQEIQWANKGWIDVIYNMDYRRGPDLDRLESANVELPQITHIFPLIANYDQDSSKNIIPRNGAFMAELLKYTQIHRPEGFGVYLYSQLTDEQILYLSKAFRLKAEPWSVNHAAPDKAYKLQLK